MKLKKILVLLPILLLACHSSSNAADSRKEIPDIFQNSYFGLDLGYTNFNFTNSDLALEYQAESIQNECFGGRIYLGHYFNPYLALQMSFMFPFTRLEFKGVSSDEKKHSVWMNLFGLTLKPTLPLSNHFSIYGNLGVGLISRRGFSIDGKDVVSDDNIATLLTGGGLSYKISKHLFFDIHATYTLPNHSKNQPPIFYTGIGAHYLIFSDKDSSVTHKTNGSDYLFPHNTINFGGFTREAFSWEVPDEFPIFWTGDVKLESGITLTYQRNFFHTERFFSLDWGVNLSRWVSKKNAEVFYGMSLFPAVKFWFIRSNKIDFYLTLGIAGPTYLSKKIIDDCDTGEHFTFYDFLGLGAFIGKNKRLNVNVQVAHYSNGNIFTENAGIRIPMIISIGYAF